MPPRRSYRSSSYRSKNSRIGREFKQSSSASVTNTALPDLIRSNAPLRASSQLLLMYSHFQSEMPADGRTPIGTWLRSHIGAYGLPSLIRFGPRSRPRVFRKDEFIGWITAPTAD